MLRAMAERALARSPAARKGHARIIRYIEWLKAPQSLKGAARTAGSVSLQEMLLLRDLAASTQGAIVEVGTYRGRSAVTLASGAPVGTAVYAVDPHEQFVGVLGGTFGPEDRAEFYRAMLRSGAWRTVRLINLPSEIAAVGWREPVGLLWIDGDHSREGVRRDWNSWSPHLSLSGRAAFDDALDPALGPHKLITDLLEGGGWRELAGAGKIRVLERCI